MWKNAPKTALGQKELAESPQVIANEASEGSPAM